MWTPYGVTVAPCWTGSRSCCSGWRASLSWPPAVALYFHEDFGWILFVVLILAPDLSFAGYALGPKVGAIAYDAVHTEIFPVALGTLGVLAGSSGPTKVAGIWLAHIGADRLVGYGLKYPTAFKDTHLSRV
jgi:hypothetical protein